MNVTTQEHDKVNELKNARARVKQLQSQIEDFELKVQQKEDLIT